MISGVASVSAPVSQKIIPTKLLPPKLKYVFE